MASKAVQALAALCLPVAAAGLGLATADPSWGPPRVLGSLKEVVEREAAAAAAAKSGPAPGAAPEIPAPVPAEGPAAKPAPAAPARSPTVEKPKAPGGDPTPPKPAPAAAPVIAAPDEIEFRVAGLCSARTALPLRTPAAERLDIHITASGAPRIGTDFATPDLAKEKIQGAEAALKEKGVLLLVPNSRAPWDAVRDLAAAGAAGGWTKVALCAGHPDNPGQGRVLALPLPSNEAPEVEKGMDLMTVKVVGAGSSATFDLNGEALADAAALEKKVKGLHEEFESFAEGYSSDPDKTPWVVDGTGAASGGVVTALDVILGAGPRTVRVAGLFRPAAPK